MRLTDNIETLRRELSQNPEFNRVTGSDEGRCFCTITVENVRFVLFHELDTCCVALSPINDFNLFWRRQQDIVTFANNLQAIASCARRIYYNHKPI